MLSKKDLKNPEKHLGPLESSKRSQERAMMCISGNHHPPCAPGKESDGNTFPESVGSVS